MNASPDEIVRTAARWINRGARLDMTMLAAELGISRTTLFRRIGGREDLLGEALWQLSEKTRGAAERRWRKRFGDVVRNHDGQLRCLWVMGEHRQAIAAHEGLRLLLDEEPAVAIRVLTDPVGRVQPRVIAAHVDLLARDAAEGGFVPRVDLDTLGFAIVRLGEAFLYSDVLASRTPDLRAASTLLAALVEGSAQAPVPARGL